MHNSPLREHIVTKFMSMRRDFFEVLTFDVIFNYNSEFMIRAEDIACVTVKYGVQNP